MLVLAKKLRSAGVLGLNRRNAEFIEGYNPRHLFPLVDDKLQTKELAKQAGIAVPELYNVLEIPAQLRALPEILEKYDDFVIKPTAGSGGEGVVVISGRVRNMYRTINGTLISSDELQHHVSNILGGMYSLGGHPDRAMIEYRVKFDSLFESISSLGVPDIRIIVFQGVPIMSMVRLPTRASDGKANLHQGAIGAGINIATGKTLTAVWKNNVIEEHPDTGNSVVGVAVPDWSNLLRLASRCFEISGLGFQGVDIVLDRERGPLILELNARPGLNIQIANRSGMLPRLRAVQDSINRLKSTEDKVKFAVDKFGTEY